MDETTRESKERSPRLRQHEVCLREGPLRLRPLTEDDWDPLLRWNNDPDVLYYSEGDTVTRYSPAEVQGIYRGTSRHAFTFLIELEAKAIGECWLQEMNLLRIKARYPEDMDLRRIDLLIGEKDLWDRGWGTRVIALLTRFGFLDCAVNAIFGCGIADYNPRSRRAFEKNGYVVDQVIPQPPGRKAREVCDMVLKRHDYASGAPVKS